MCRRSWQNRKASAVCRVKKKSKQLSASPAKPAKNSSWILQQNLKPSRVKAKKSVCWVCRIKSSPPAKKEIKKGRAKIFFDLTVDPKCAPGSFPRNLFAPWRCRDDGQTIGTKHRPSWRLRASWPAEREPVKSANATENQEVIMCCELQRRLSPRLFLKRRMALVRTS